MEPVAGVLEVGRRLRPRGRSPPPMMSAFVEVFDRFGRGLDVQFYFLSGKEVPPRSSLASREERDLNVTTWERG